MTDFSLIETMRFDPGEGIARLSLHMKRLENSARKLGFEGADKAEAALLEYLGNAPPQPLPTRGKGKDTAPAAQTSELSTNGKAETNQISRPTLSPSPLWEGVGEGQDAPLRLRLELSKDGKINITSAPFTLQPPDTIWRVAIAKTRASSTNPLIRHKTTRRTIYEAARAEYPAGEISEVILLNEKSELAEGTITNIFIDDGTGKLLTPPLSSGCLAGVLRTALICGKKAVNQRLRPEDLQGKTIYLGNSLRGLIKAELV